MKRRYVVVAGSNADDSRLNVEKAVKFIAKQWKILRKSEIYTTPDFLGSGKSYNNAVIEFESEIATEAMEIIFKEYEKEEGRTPEAKTAGHVPIDLDIVVCDGEILRIKDFNTRYFKMGYNQL